MNSETVRDLIVLLNLAFTQSARSGRKELVKSDIESASKQISSDRLTDLQKEYDVVFPGLTMLINLFKGKQAFQKFSTIVSEIDFFIEHNEYLLFEASDFAILGSGKSAFYALYSIGFLGLENPSNKNIQFCHDGSQANMDIIKPEQSVCVHPCYWKALEIQSEIFEENVLIELYDDNKPPSNAAIKDQRIRMIGHLISQLPSMPEGIESSSQFEDWAFRAIQILFSGFLTNPELKPNGNAVQRRDIVATNMAKEGFWKRLCDDYKSRQVIFEIKNYINMKIEDYRQALSYSGKQYGSFVLIVNRNPNEGLSDIERNWVKEFWDQHNVLIFSISATFLSKCISKLRSRQRFDYADNQLSKRLDVYLRSYLSLHPANKKKNKKSI
jgi:hypothetical protein